MNLMQMVDTFICRPECLHSESGFPIIVILFIGSLPFLFSELMFVSITAG